jgi:hypothetical protein
MAALIAVGNHWINLDQVQHVELMTSRKDPERRRVRVHLIGGKHIDFKDAAEVAELVQRLSSHKAT